LDWSGGMASILMLYTIVSLVRRLATAVANPRQLSANSLPGRGPGIDHGPPAFLVVGGYPTHPADRLTTPWIPTDGGPHGCELLLAGHPGAHLSHAAARRPLGTRVAQHVAIAAAGTTEVIELDERPSPQTQRTRIICDCDGVDRVCFSTRRHTQVFALTGLRCRPAATIGSCSTIIHVTRPDQSLGRPAFGLFGATAALSFLFLPPSHSCGVSQPRCTQPRLNGVLLACVTYLTTLPPFGLERGRGPLLNGSYRKSVRASAVDFFQPAARSRARSISTPTINRDCTMQAVASIQTGCGGPP